MTVSARQAYRDELANLGYKDSRIVCIEADLGGQGHPFQRCHPDRFFNLGIAEAAAVDICVGMAKSGLIPFFSTFATFAALRAAESIKLVGYMNANVKIVAPYGGVAGAWFGTTHHCLEDFAVIQSIPGICIAAPYGEEETRRVIQIAANVSKPFYVRLGRNETYTSLPSDASLNQIVWQYPEEKADTKSNVCLVSIGESATYLCIQARNCQPWLSHAHLCLVDLASLQSVVPELEKKYRLFLVVEEHRLCGSIASTLALLMPNSRLFSFNCGSTYISEGGDYQDIRNVLRFDIKNLLSTISTLPLGTEVSAEP